MPTAKETGEKKERAHPSTPPRTTAVRGPAGRQRPHAKPDIRHHGFIKAETASTDRSRSRRGPRSGGPRGTWHAQAGRRARIGGEGAGSFWDAGRILRGRFGDGSGTIRGRFEDHTRTFWRRKRGQTTPATPPAMARSRARGEREGRRLASATARAARRWGVGVVRRVERGAGERRGDVRRGRRGLRAG